MLGSLRVTRAGTNGISISITGHYTNRKVRRGCIPCPQSARLAWLYLLQRKVGQPVDTMRLRHHPSEGASILMKCRRKGLKQAG
jgi:hypothetical protein